MRVVNTTTGLSFSLFSVWVVRAGNQIQMNKQFTQNTEMCVCMYAYTHTHTHRDISVQNLGAFNLSSFTATNGASKRKL